MFTLIPHSRPANLFLIAALAILTVILLTLAVFPVIPAPKQVIVPVTGNLETGSDYYQRHPELRLVAVATSDRTSDFALRHPEWSVSVQNAAVPVTGIFESSDYFQRHPEVLLPSLSLKESAVDLSDYFARHPELQSAKIIDLTDYFFRHP